MNELRLRSSLFPTAMQAIALLAGLLLVQGCGTTGEQAETPSGTATPPAAVRAVQTVPVVVGNLDLSGWSGRVDRSQIDELASVLRREKVEVLGVQGITRYPTLRNRVDFVAELAAAMEYRQAYGETIALSGRETGNAVFSSYPIQSSDNVHYEGLSGTGFESALHALIDVGVRELAVVSTRTPGSPTADDRGACERGINAVAGSYKDTPVAVLGNLRDLRPGPEWREIATGNTGVARVWISGAGMDGGGTRSVVTPFGTLVLAEMEVSGRPVP